MEDTRDNRYSLKFPDFKGDDFPVWKAKVLAKVKSRGIEIVLLDEMPRIAFTNEVHEVSEKDDEGKVVVKKATRKVRSPERE